MKKIFIVEFLLLFIIVSCKYQNTNNIITNSSYDILVNQGINKFLDKMTTHDTLLIVADLSVCIGRIKYYNRLTKNNDVIYIETKAVDKTEGDNIIVDFGKTIYNRTDEDSLNLEDFLCYVQKEYAVIQEEQHPIIQIIYKTDTLSYKSKGILNILAFTDYYTTIMRQIYPNREQYPGILIMTDE
jgi:hypothetical protein